MKDLFMNDNETYDLRHDHNDGTMMEDMSSYRPGDSLAETEVSSSQQPNHRFIERFRFWSILGFTSTLMCTWELAIGTSYFALINGGISGLVWGYLATSIAMGFVVASLAEIASMAPTHGGLYHWVGEFAPKEVQRYLSYVTGWMSVLVWVVGAATLNYMAGTMIQSLVELWHPQYSMELWHGTLIVFGIGLLCAFLNTFAVKYLPIIELITLFVHFLGIFVFLFPLWILAPKTPAREVFLNFKETGGWGNIGVACLVGQIGPLFALCRTDGGVHIAENLPSANRLIPRSMTTTSLISALTGFATILTFAFTSSNLPSLLASASASNSNYPFITAYYLATSSKGLTTAIVTVILILLVGASLSVQATAARHIFAFARDEALPFPRIWSKVTRIGGSDLPLNAFGLCLAGTSAVALLSLGLDSVFHFLVSLFVGASLTGYFLAIACSLTARVSRAAELPERGWSMGWVSVPVNVVALAYIVLMFVMSFFPLEISGLRPSNMNWAAAVWVGVLGFSTVLYVVHARYVFRAAMVVSPRSFDERSSSQNV